MAELKRFTDITYHPFFGDYICNQMLKPTLELIRAIAVMDAAAVYKCTLQKYIFNVSKVRGRGAN